MVGLVVLVIVVAFLMFSAKEGFQNGYITKTLTGATNVVKQAVGNTVGLAAEATGAVAGAADAAVGALAQGAKNVATSSYGVAAAAGSTTRI